MCRVTGSFTRSAARVRSPVGESKNWAKHTVSQSECEQVFFNDPLVLAADPAHSAREGRYFALGQTDEGRLLLVVFTLRGSLIRVISARPMSRREREVYADAEG